VAIETLVEQAHARAIGKQDLDRRPTLAEEHEQRAAASGTADLLLDEPCQTIKAPSQVDGYESNVDLDAARNHRFASHGTHASVSKTTDSVLRSMSAVTSMRACPICTTMGADLAVGCFPVFRTTRAIGIR
jgi:hypothetical protein